jgi:septum site-determining protein MinC
MADGAEQELFGTATMAELCARQGRITDAITIYRRLLVDRPGAEQQRLWMARLEALEQGRGVEGNGPQQGASAPTVSVGLPAPAARARPRPLSSLPAAVPLAPPAAAPVEAHRPAVIVRQAVRSGQTIYAEKTDLIVLGPVNAGAELIADGNIHIYSVLRGRAVAGVQGYAEANIFCQRLEAELVAISGIYIPYEDIPLDRVGRPAHVYLRDGGCVIAPL